MRKVINKIEKWISNAFYDMYPNLTKHMKK